MSGEESCRSIFNLCLALLIDNHNQFIDKQAVLRDNMNLEKVSKICMQVLCKDTQKDTHDMTLYYNSGISEGKNEFFPNPLSSNICSQET